MLLTTAEKTELIEELESYLLEFRSVSVKALLASGEKRQYYLDIRSDINKTVDVLHEQIYGAQDFRKDK